MNLATAPEWPALVPSARIAALAERMLTLADRSGLRIATAESCTGGLLASLLADAGDHGDVFVRGFVVATDATKHELLGVPLELLSAAGVVSEPVARLMAEGALARSEADVALAITCSAEPGRYPQDAAGMAWFGCARRGELTWTRSARFGDVGHAAICRGCLGGALELALGVLHP
ncbi:nicotinamide-nucleotide amidohydrolase family protein [Phenylobacterium sp. LjRoot219]|uniref:CinA family protein n=1 Tax=Phenylobacterium sp. LjRoot219 TaxID=3342283 RepID=UPI003ECCAF2D